MFLKILISALHSVFNYHNTHGYTLIPLRMATGHSYTNYTGHRKKMKLLSPQEIS